MEKDAPKLQRYSNVVKHLRT